MYGKKESPVNGNAFTKAMADSGGDYNEAKQMLGSPAEMKDEKGSAAYMRACGYKK
jgi:hypothetical protein